MDKILFDSHAHISDEAFENFGLDEKIKESAVKYCMDIGTSLKTSADAVNSAHVYDYCFATVGVHPSEVAELTDELLEECLSAYLTEEKVVAVGEIGLDYHYDDGPSRELQKEWFGKQLDWALANDAPVCIHSRDADADTLELLKAHGAFSAKRAAAFPAKPDGKPDCRILIHCFSGSAELAGQYIKLGASISLGGPVTFKNARKAVEVAAAVELGDILIETDSPYMAPEPVRGTVNTPCNVLYVAQKLADLKGYTLEEAARVTMENACRFYGIKED